mgnify:CR=1 FL=1
MKLLKKRLAALLFKQSWNNVQEASLPFEQIPSELQGKYLKYTDEIIELFVDAIKNLEFNPIIPSKPT